MMRPYGVWQGCRRCKYRAVCLGKGRRHVAYALIARKVKPDPTPCAVIQDLQEDLKNEIVVRTLSG